MSVAMREHARASDANSGVRGATSRRDMAIVALATFVAALLSIHFELSETIVAWTRPWEHLQLDETPLVLLVLSTGLAWFAGRRYREAHAELTKRRAAESQLEHLLLENRKLGQELVRVQESERKRLAQELHDELGQYLNAIKIEAVTLERRAAEPAIRANASHIIQHLDHVYAVVRDLIRKLRPVGLDDLGLKAALEHHVNDWRGRLPGVEIRIAFEGELDGIGEPASMAIYRFVQEGMTNVARHAGARRVEIDVKRSRTERGEQVVFSMSDDGVGADPVRLAHGLGLIGMRERVEMLGGRLEVRARPGRGFSILACVPLVASAEETSS